MALYFVFRAMRWEVRKEEEWKILQATPMVSRRGNQESTLVHKVVNLPYLHVFDMVACVLMCMVTWLCVTYLNDWSSISNYTMAMSMLYEALSMQECHYVNMSLYKASISCTSIYIARIVWYHLLLRFPRISSSPTNH